MDAINGGQLYGALDSTAQMLGGGAAVTAFGTISAPTYMVQGGNYFNVGDALSALDGAISGLDSRVTELESFPGNGNNGSGNNGSGGRSTGGSTSETAVAGTGGRTSVGDGDAATGGNEGQITNVADGVAATDAVNKGQLDTGIADAKAYTDTTATQTLSSANAYTDAKFAAWDDTFAAFQGEIDHRLAEQDRRIDKQGAMGAAMLNMATSAAGTRTQNRVGVGRPEVHTVDPNATMHISYDVYHLNK